MNGDHAARRVRRRGLRRRGTRRSRRSRVGAGALWGQVYDAVTTQGRPLRAGRRLHDRRRRGPDPERRLRQLLQGLRPGRGEPAGGRGRHRRRRRADRQCLHASRSCSGRSRAAVAAASASSPGSRCGRTTCRRSSARVFADDQGQLGRRVPPADRPDRRLLRRQPVQSALGRADRASGPSNVLAIAMVFQGLDQQQAEATWRPFLDWVAGSPQDFSIESGPLILGRAGAALLGRRRCSRTLPGLVIARRPPGRARRQRVLGGRPGRGRAGPARLPIGLAARGAAADGPARASRRRAVRGEPALGRVAACQQGPGGRARRGASPPPATRRSIRPCSTPSRWRSAAAEGPPAYPGVAGHEPDLATARSARRRDRPGHGRAAQAGAARRLLRVGEQLLRAGLAASRSGARTMRGCWPSRTRYDPDGLFFVHHGVGSERWSADGFVRAA